MIKKTIRIKLLSEREEYGERLFEGEDMDLYAEPQDEDSQESEPEGPIEMFTEGELYVTDERVIIAYEESELTGMEGSYTQVRFERRMPGLVTMTRNGSVSTILIFEENKRHICTYQTPYMPFQICVFTKKVENTLLEDGKIVLDYVVEIRGAQAERTFFTLEIFEDAQEPEGE